VYVYSGGKNAVSIRVPILCGVPRTPRGVPNAVQRRGESARGTPHYNNLSPIIQYSSILITRFARQPIDLSRVDIKEVKLIDPPDRTSTPSDKCMSQHQRSKEPGRISMLIKF